MNPLDGVASAEEARARVARVAVELLVLLLDDDAGLGVQGGVVEERQRDSEDGGPFAGFQGRARNLIRGSARNNPPARRIAP